MGAQIGVLLILNALCLPKLHPVSRVILFASGLFFTIYSVVNVIIFPE